MSTSAAGVSVGTAISESVTQAGKYNKDHASDCTDATESDNSMIFNSTGSVMVLGRRTRRNFRVIGNAVCFITISRKSSKAHNVAVILDFLRQAKVLTG
jgi:hypothetical protein